MRQVRNCQERGDFTFSFASCQSMVWLCRSVGLVGVVSGDMGGVLRSEWQGNKVSYLGLQQTDRYSPDQQCQNFVKDCKINSMLFCSV